MTVCVPTLEQLGPKPSVTAPSTLAHVVLQTPPENLAKMRDFYCTWYVFLGAHVVHTAPFGSFLTYDDEHHRIALVALPNTVEKAANAAGLQHIAFAFSSLRDLLTAYVQRRAHGIEPVMCTNHGPTTSIYYKDPDGNMLETQVDNFATPAEATAYMNSEAFKNNAIGMAFKPEEMIEKLNSGVDEKSLMVRDDEQGWGTLTLEMVDGL